MKKIILEIKDKDDLRKLSKEIMHLVLESEDDYEGIYAVEDKLKEYLKKIKVIK